MRDDPPEDAGSAAEESRATPAARANVCHICGGVAYRACDTCGEPTCREHLLLDLSWDIWWGMCTKCFKEVGGR